jgi:cytochrome c oxidase subunit III
MSVVSEVNLKRIHPKKFALWMAIVSMIMFFSAFTSAYIVRKSAGNWLSFPLPYEFYYSTVVILLSSLTFYLSKKAYLEGNNKLFKSLFFSGFVLGLIFIYLQYLGWNSLHALDISISTNQSSSFFYLITYAHVLHVIGGLAALIVTMTGIILGRFDYPSDKRSLKLDLVYTYWHFVDILWVYLLLFLMIQQ